VEGLTNITSIAAGECQSFAVDKNGTVWGWGKNDQGEFGIGKTGDLLRPTVISLLET
jgi:alpha-tubulin suppressor-like RCC1 family protein